MQPNPLQQTFWDDELKRALDLFGPVMLRILFAGATGGASALPAGVEILIDWDVVNEDALHWLNTHGLRWLAKINDTTRRQVVGAIDSWVRSGEHMSVLEQRLLPILGPGRAERIAVTEVTRMYAEGNLAAWRSTGVVGGKRWQTGMDDLVCPICAPLQGKIVGLTDGWTMDESGNVVGGLGLLAPPAHTRCRCYLLPVVDEDLFTKRLRETIANAR